MQFESNIDELQRKQDEINKEAGNEATNDATVKYKAAGAAMNTALKSGNNGSSKVGGGLMSYGAATGNPYLLAGGAAMSVLGAKQQQEEDYRKALYEAEQLRKQRLSNSLTNMAQIYSGMKL